MQVNPVLAAVIDLDVTYFFQLVLFLFLVVLLNKLAFQPLLALMERRKRETEEREREARSGQDEADQLLTKYDDEIAAARAEGMGLRNQARDEALRAEAERLAEVRGESSRWLDGEVSRFADEIEAARRAAEPQVAGLAAEIVESLTHGGADRARGGE